MILSNKINNSNNLNKFWVGNFIRQGHSIKQLASFKTFAGIKFTRSEEWVSDKRSQWSDSGPIIISYNIEYYLVPLCVLIELIIIV